MIATNDDIYNILRQDLHLSEEKISKSEVKEVSLKLEFVTKELAEIKMDVKELVGSLSARIAIFITIAVGFMGMLMNYLGKQH
nr:hypothetical protein [uncultured Chitinophaga sp.]